MKSHSSDKFFLTLALILTAVGVTIFSSASLGLIAREGERFSSVASTQLIMGLGAGLVALFFASRINYHNWRKYAFFIFIGALLLTAAVFIPGIGFEHGGAKRWIPILGITFQPAEFLKIAFIFYFAAWLSGVKEKASTLKFGTLPFVIILLVVGILLLLQPDTDTFAVISISGLAMFITAGAKIKHVIALGIIIIIAGGALIYERPYLQNRLETYFDPSKDSQGSGYQIQQSLIAIGSGGAFGRGFGKSIQKFYYLPEPIGDSIFAVAGEEFGFIGTATLVLLFVLFGARGLRIAARAPDAFGRLTVTGIVILIVSQSFVNIAAMLGVLPLSGIPLVFVSHGGTALLTALFATGVVINISKYQTS